MNGKAENTGQVMWKIVKTADGSETVYSQQFEEHYHSLWGAVAESEYVYIQQGLDYYRKIVFPQSITVFEVGFGTGIDALLTYLWAQQTGIKTHYIGIEKFPLPDDIVKRLNLGQLEAFRETFLRLHQLPWQQQHEIGTNFLFTKIKDDWTSFDIEQFLGKDTVDVVFYDAFSYETQPQMWSKENFSKLYDVVKPLGIITTYAAKGQIKRNLYDAGFFVERLTGALKKRHMLRAIKPKKGRNIVRYISISNIKFDNIPINPQTLDLAMKIYNKQIDPDELAPIRVMQLPQGQYLIRDGRHRVTAFKLNGFSRIKAYIFFPKQNSLKSD